MGWAARHNPRSREYHRLNKIQYKAPVNLPPGSVPVVEKPSYIVKELSFASFLNYIKGFLWPFKRKQEAPLPDILPTN